MNQIERHMNEEQEKRMQDVFQYVKSSAESAVYTERLSEIDPRKFSKELLPNIIPMKREELGAYEGTLLHIPESRARYLVSEFNNDVAERLFLVGTRKEKLWKELDSYIKGHGMEGAVIAVSRNWQLGSFFYQTCRAHEIPCTVFSHRDAPYIARLIEEVGVDTVVTTPDVAHAAYELLRKQNLEHAVKLWLLIVELGVPTEIPQLSGTIVVEHHIFPGISLGKSIDGTHIQISDEYFVETDERGVYITSLEQHAVPLVRFFLAGSAKVRQLKHGVELSFVAGRKD